MLCVWVTVGANVMHAQEHTFRELLKEDIQIFFCCNNHIPSVQLAGKVQHEPTAVLVTVPSYLLWEPMDHPPHRTKCSITLQRGAHTEFRWRYFYGEHVLSV